MKDQFTKLINNNIKLAIKLLPTTFSNYKEMMNGIDWTCVEPTWYNLASEDKNNLTEFVFKCLVSRSSKIAEYLEYILPPNEIIAICKKLYSFSHHYGRDALHLCSELFDYEDLKPHLDSPELHATLAMFFSNTSNGSHRLWAEYVNAYLDNHVKSNNRRTISHENGLMLSYSSENFSINARPEHAVKYLEDYIKQYQCFDEWFFWGMLLHNINTGIKKNKNSKGSRYIKTSIIALLKGNVKNKAITRKFIDFVKNNHSLIHTNRLYETKYHV